MTNFTNIPISLLIVLLIQAVWIIAVFGLIQHIVLRLIRKEWLHDKVAFYNPLFRNIAWVLFTINTVYRLAEVNPVVSLVVVGIVLALGWQSIRDFIQGTVFRFQKGNIKGQRLKVKSYDGIVSKMENTKIELMTDNEEIIQIPYSKIISAVTSKPTATKHLIKGQIYVDLAEDSTVEAAASMLKTQLMNMPWVITSKGVKVEKVAGKNQLKIAFSTLNEGFVERVRSEILENNI